MKKKLLEEREKAIIENFETTFNKIKRLDEINIGKGLAALGLAAGLMGAPEDLSAQSTPAPKYRTFYKDIADSTDEVAGTILIKSYLQNTVSANRWAPESKQNRMLLKAIKSAMYNAKKNPKGITQLGALYKKTKTAKNFLARDTQEPPKVKPEMPIAPPITGH